MLSFSISYWDLIKFPYFVDITEEGDRGWKQAQTQQGDFTDKSIARQRMIYKVTLATAGNTRVMES